MATPLALAAPPLTVLVLFKHSHTALLHLNPDPKAICRTRWPLRKFMCLRT